MTGMLLLAIQHARELKKVYDVQAPINWIVDAAQVGH